MLRPPGKRCPRSGRLCPSPPCGSFRRLRLLRGRGRAVGRPAVAVALPEPDAGGSKRLPPMARRRPRPARRRRGRPILIRALRMGAALSAPPAPSSEVHSRHDAAVDSLGGARFSRSPSAGPTRSLSRFARSLGGGLTYRILKREAQLVTNHSGPRWRRAAATGEGRKGWRTARPPVTRAENRFRRKCS